MRIHLWNLGHQDLLILFSICIFSNASASDAWDFEHPDYPAEMEEMTDRSLCFDSAGNPHVVYGKDHLYYAKKDGALWAIQRPPGDFGDGSYAAVRLDSNNNPHIGCYNHEQENLIYYRHDGSTWHRCVIDSISDVGTHVSIAIDSIGIVHLVYFDNLNDDLKYAWGGIAEWTIEVVDAAGRVGTEASLQVDSMGNPHVVYRDRTIVAIKYAKKDALGWHIQRVDDGIDGGTNASIALDQQDRPHVAYINSRGHDLIYAFLSESLWQWVYVDTLDNLGYEDPSITTEPSGTVHISYFDRENSDLKHAYGTVNGWHTEILDSDGTAGKYTSIDGSPSGDIAISYYNQSNRSLKLTTSSTDEWRIETIDGYRDMGSYTTLAKDSEDHLHLGYYDETNGDLRYAYEDDFGWHVEIVDSRGRTGKSPVLAIGTLDRPHIAYTGTYAGNHVRYAYKDDFGWHIEDVSEDIPNSKISFALDEYNSPHIAIAKHSNSDNHLYYAYRKNGAWVIELLDHLGDEFVSVSLQCDSFGFPHFGISGNPLVYAFFDGFGWHTEIVQYNTPGDHISLALDTTNLPYLCFSNSAADEVRLAYRGLSGWEIETVDDDIDAVEYITPDMDITPDGRIHLSYSPKQGSSYILRYAVKFTGQWLVEDVDLEYNVGIYSSIVLTEAGDPVISYADLTHDAPKIARCTVSLHSPQFPKSTLQEVVRLDQIAPNPVIRSTALTYSVPSGDAEISLYNLQGRLISSLFEGSIESGRHSLKWSPKSLPPGSYIIRLFIKDRGQDSKIIVIGN